MGCLSAVSWERFVVVRSCRGGVKGKVELVVPAELEASLGQAVVPFLRHSKIDRAARVWGCAGGRGIPRLNKGRWVKVPPLCMSP